MQLPTVIDCGIDLTGFINVSGNTYYAPLSVNPNGGVWENYIPGADYNRLQTGLSTGTLITGQYFWNSANSRIYVNSFYNRNLSLSGSNISCSFYDYGITGNGTGQSFEYFEIRRARVSAFFTSFPQNKLYHINTRDSYNAFTITGNHTGAFIVNCLTENIRNQHVVLQTGISLSYANSNCYDNRIGSSTPFNTNNTNYSYANWKLLGYDGTGSNANPQINFYGGILSTGSPVYNTGLVLLGINDGYFGSAPDIGAVENDVYFSGLSTQLSGSFDDTGLSNNSSIYDRTPYGRSTTIESPSIDISDNIQSRNINDNSFIYNPSIVKTIITYQKSLQEIVYPTGISETGQFTYRFQTLAPTLLSTGSYLSILNSSSLNSCVAADSSSITGISDGISLKFNLGSYIPTGSIIDYVELNSFVSKEDSSAYVGITPFINITGSIYTGSSFWITKNLNSNSSSYPVLTSNLTQNNIEQISYRWNSNPLNSLSIYAYDIPNWSFGIKGIQGSSPSNDFIFLFNTALKFGWHDTGQTIIEINDPVSYEIGITPDLGWPNIESMFSPYNESDPLNTNSKLFLKKVSRQDLILSDRKLSISLSANELGSIIGYGYKNYIWSIRSYDSSNLYSNWSNFRRFTATYELPNSFIKIDILPKTVNNRLLKVSGVKNNIIDTIEVNGLTGNINYNSSTQWSSIIPLSGGTNSIKIRGKQSNGQYTSYIVNNVVLETGQIKKHFLYNTFDDFGAIHGIERIKAWNEDNISFKERIEDVFVHPSDPTLKGLHNSICRELDLNYSDEAFIIQPGYIENSGRIDKVFPDLRMEIRTNDITLTSANFIVDLEYHIVDPGNLSIMFDNEPNYDAPISLYSPIGVQLDSKLYNVNYLDHSIKFSDDSFKYREVYIRYSKKYSISIGNNISLSNVYSSLTGLSHNDRLLLSVAMDDNLIGTEKSDGLLRESFTISSTERYLDSNNSPNFGHRVRWSDLSIHKITDKDYQLRYLNRHGNLLNTKIEADVNAFKNKAHLTWNNSRLNKDTWDSVSEETENASSIPGQIDSIKGYYISNNRGDDYRYSLTEAIDHGFISEIDKGNLVYNGIKIQDIKSGIRMEDDLKIVLLDNKTIEVLEEPGLYRSTISYNLTGQIQDSTFLPQTIAGGLLFEI